MLRLASVLTGVSHAHPRTAGKLKARRFTLIELFVVMGMIGVLVTLLLPKLVDARKRARWTTWQGLKSSNMKDPRCIVYYPFEEGSGATTENMASAGLIETTYDKDEFNGQILQAGALTSSQWTTGRFRSKKALSYNGTDVCVDCGNSSAWSLVKNQGTFEAWVYPMSLFGNTVFGREFGFTLFASPGNTMPMLSNNGMMKFISAQAFPVQEWTLISVVYTGSQINVYVNGVLNATDNYSNGIDYLMTPRDLVIGARDTGGGTYTSYWDGVIDEVAIFKEALGAEEISQHYELGRP